MGVTHHDASEEEQLLRGQLLRLPAGLIVTALDHNLVTRKLVERRQAPCGHLMDLPASGHVDAPYCVGFRQTDAGAALTRHLLAQGRRRIAFAAAQLDACVMQWRYGWRIALQEAGVHEPALEWLNPAPSSLALGGVLFEQIMQQRPAVDAVLFCNEDLAQGALMAAWRLGIAVPSRMAIAGLNDLTGSDQMLPTLTTVRTPRAQIGEAAAHMLLSLMRGEAPARPQLDLGFEIVQRQSTCNRRSLQAEGPCRTLTSGNPVLKRVMLSASVSCRRRTVPAVQPDMWGVMSTLSRDAKSNADGAHSGCDGVG